jgi:hypothetical protein
VEASAIVARVDEGTRVADHTYLIWQGGQVGDFELSLKFRSDAGNSGSTIVPARGPEAPAARPEGASGATRRISCGLDGVSAGTGRLIGQFAIERSRSTDSDEGVSLADANAVRSIGYRRIGGTITRSRSAAST